MAESNQTKLLSSSLVLILALLTRNHRSTPTVYRAKKKAPEAEGCAKGDGGDRGHMGDMGNRGHRGKGRDRGHRDDWVNSFKTRDQAKNR